MKTAFVTLCTILILSLSGYSQKKNGTVYIEHNAIEKTRQLWKAFEKGDKEQYLSFLADSIKVYSNGNTTLHTKESLGKQFDWYQNSFKNLIITDQEPAFPDAIEYDKGGLWVQDWLKLDGIHIKSGINLNLPIHHLYHFNKDGKIASIHFFYNNDVFQEIRDSETIKENGKVFISHPYIVTVRKLMNAFIAKDIDTWASYFTNDAKFSNSFLPYGKVLSLEETKQRISEAYFNDNIEYTIEQYGYPDCIFYAKSNDYVVYSWWKMTSLKDGKKSVYVFMLTHNFDADGKIAYESLYMVSSM